MPALDHMFLYIVTFLFSCTDMYDVAALIFTRLGSLGLSFTLAQCHVLTIDIRALVFLSLCTLLLVVPHIHIPLSSLPSAVPFARGLPKKKT